MEKQRKHNVTSIAIAGTILVAVILILGTIWMGHAAKTDTEDAVHSISKMYLNELAGRREQVVENNLQRRIQDAQIAIDLMDPSDLKSKSSLEAYQSRMKSLYHLDRFAFVDTDGLIYTSMGTQTNIDEFKFDYKTISEPEISIFNLSSADKAVIIALPVDIRFQNKRLCVCFMQIAMDEMLAGVSLDANPGDSTFCNIYTKDGIALTNAILGGLAEEDNLVEAMLHAEFDEGYSFDVFFESFRSDESGEVSFTYDGIRETLSYTPIVGTDWVLTYLIRESIISERIASISNSIITRSVIQSVLTALVLIAMFGFILRQNKKNAALQMEKETAEAENRVKQQEMADRLALQEKLLEQEKQRTRQDSMITAMASDYRSVYQVDLNANEGICFRADPDDPEQTPPGQPFSYLERFTWYAEHAVAESYREGFLCFIDPASIREGLRKEPILVYRYLAQRAGAEYYEMIRVADAQPDENDPDHIASTIGLGLTVIDAEMRESMAQQQALSDALSSAEQANKAKTAFLSNMSHEIRTPMNAIIGLDNIALNDPETPPRTREYLEKIGSSADHLLQLINDILDMSRIESGRLTFRNEEFSFPQLLKAINTMFSGQCADKGLDYQCHINGEVDDYYIGDNMKLRQVLINILGNAVKFTPAGGKVSFEVERKAHFDGKTALQFTISDTGIGMSEAFLPHIFDTFAQEDSTTTNRYGSSGLGLAITKNIVEMMNGNIEVKSVKGEGSTFVVSVTLADSPHNASENDIEEIHPGEMTVLVVDDDPIACEHAKLVLEKAGIAAEIAVSGTEAVEMVRLRHARREPYNLILVDWQMPEMDGVEATRQIRSIVGNESAIIILTAYRWDDVFEEAMQAGVDCFIPKPLFAATVLEEFRSAMKRKGVLIRRQEKKAELSGRRILLAEDIQVNAEIMIMLLQMRNIKAEHAENGRLAVEMFASHPAGYYDAILMDMRMPEMDGLEATRRIRALDRADAKEIPIIALTANAFDEDVQHSLQAGLNAHLSKPVQPETLYETLEGLIRE